MADGHSHGRLQRGDEREEDVGIVRIGVPEEIGKALREHLARIAPAGPCLQERRVRPWS